MARLPALSTGDAATYLVALEAGVTGFGTNTPPGSPSANETYILGASPTGAWSGNANKVASYISSAWVFLPASGAIGTSQRGLRLGGASSDAFYLWNGTAWTSYAAPTRLVDHQNSIDPLPQYLMRYEATGGDGGSAAWGDITGTLSSQTDLNTALNARATKTWTATTVSLGNGAGVFESVTTISDANVSGSSVIEVQLGATTDADENEPEMLDVLAIGAKPGTGSFELTLAFASLHSGPVKVQYRVN